MLCKIDAHFQNNCWKSKIVAGDRRDKGLWGGGGRGICAKLNTSKYIISITNFVSMNIFSFFFLFRLHK